MDYNIDQIASELKEINSNMVQFLDKIEPVLKKDKFLKDDIDFLKSIEFKLFRFESFTKILFPLLDTDESGHLLKLPLINNLLTSTLISTKKRLDAIFNKEIISSNEKLNEYKSKFFEACYSIDFTNKFIDNLNDQRLHLDLVLSYFSTQSYLFDFNELTNTASKEPDLNKRLKLYIDEYNRVNLLWIKNNDSYKCNIPINSPDNEFEQTEPYNEEEDDEFQSVKKLFFDFLDKCKKSIESLNYQINNYNHKNNVINPPVSDNNYKPTEIVKSNINKIELILDRIQYLNNLNFIVDTDNASLTPKYEDYDFYDETKEIEKAIRIIYVKGSLDALKRIKKLIEISIQHFGAIAPMLKMNFEGKEIIVDAEVVQNIYDSNIKHLNDLVEIINPLISGENQEIIFDIPKKDTKYETLKSNLYNNGFFELKKVKSLSHDGQSKLIELLILNDIPYRIALFDFLGFLKYLVNEKLLTNTAIHKKISALFECSSDTIKGNMLALNEHSKIDKDRYTSHLHKEKVKTDYNSLK